MDSTVTYEMGQHGFSQEAWGELPDARMEPPAAVPGVKNGRKKLRGVALLKVGLAIIIMLVMGLAVFYGGPMLLKRAKISNTRTELDQLRTAVMLYTATSTTGKAPTDFTFITNGYTDQAGMTVKDTVPKRWQEDGIVDPWGQAYTITVNTDGVTGTISSPGVPGDSTPISVSF